jgi:hypothetical protein
MTLLVKNAILTLKTLNEQLLIANFILPSLRMFHEIRLNFTGEGARGPCVRIESLSCVINGESGDHKTLVSCSHSKVEGLELLQ